MKSIKLNSVSIICNYVLEKRKIADQPIAMVYFGKNKINAVKYNTGRMHNYFYRVIKKANMVRVDELELGKGEEG